MKDRINQIIRAKNLTAAEFAMKLGIQPSSVSHLLAGRNNPSLDFVKKLKETFPEYNLDWIIFGKGPVTVSEPFREAALEKKANEVETIPARTVINNNNPSTLFDIEEEEASDIAQNYKQKSFPEVKYLVFVFQDNTFKVLHPSGT